MIVDRYYYGKLPEEEKAVYREMYQGCLAHQKVIPITAFKEKTAGSYARILQALSDDNPLLYYVNQSAADIGVDTEGNMAYLPQYFFSADTVKDYHRKIQAAVNQLIFDLKLSEGSDLEKVRKVHDYMCSAVSYDRDGADLSSIPRLVSSHTIIGVFAHRRGQCEGIAKAVKVLLNAVDVRCIYVTGKASVSAEQVSDHGWNIVNIDECPYQLDVTFDVDEKHDGFISYDYYNVTDRQMRKDHVFSAGYPKCTSKEANYFEREGTVFTSQGKLLEYAERQFQSGADEVYFKTAGKLKVKEAAEGVFRLAELTAERDNAEKRIGRRINESMNTCRVFLR